MKMTIKNTALAAALAACTFSANAQQLQTEITIDRTIQPEVRDALRLNGPSPAITVPEVPAARLNPAEYTNPGTLTIDLGVLPAARWADSVAHTPYRGYASIGYFPTFNLGANAGYRFIDNDRANAGVWMQYNGTSYKDDMPLCPGAALNRNYVSLGANGSYRVNGYSLLTAAADYTYSSVSHPLPVNSFSQQANEFNINTAWRSAIGRISYGAGIGFGYFGMPDDTPSWMTPRRNCIDQRNFDLAFNIGLSDSRGSRPWIGMDIDWRYLHANDQFGDYNDPASVFPTVNIGEAHFHPYFRAALKNVNLRIGMNLSVGHGEGHSRLKFAPEVMIDYGGSGKFSVFASVSGGERLNLMRDLYAQNPYVFAATSYGRTNIPFRLDAGFTFIPANGFKVNVTGAYAIARGLLTPFVFTIPGEMYNSLYMPDGVNSWRLSAVVEYSLRSLLKVSLEGAVGGADNDWSSWMEWSDAAKCRTALKATLTPIDPLAINVSYSIATGRKVCDLTGSDKIMLNKSSVASLGVARSLDLGASWMINPAFTAFIKIENLLNQHCMMISMMPEQGIRGLAGIAVKF